MNLFDGLQAAAQRIVTTTFGDSATWIPLAGGSYTGDVLYNEPTQKEQVGDQDYITGRPRMEYLDGLFPGLLDSVLDKAPETVTVNGTTYACMWGERKYDGKTIIIYLDPIQ